MATRLGKKLTGVRKSGQLWWLRPDGKTQVKIKYLEKADDGRMDWMGEFKSPSKLRGKKSHEEIMTYLKGEKVKVEQVKYDMLTSIKSATEVFDSYNKDN